MSILVTYDVQCDHEDCLEWTDGVSGYRGVREARRAARGRGWTRHHLPDGRLVDLCPKHSALPEPQEGP